MTLVKVGRKVSNTKRKGGWVEGSCLSLFFGIFPGGLLVFLVLLRVDRVTPNDKPKSRCTKVEVKGSVPSRDGGTGGGDLSGCTLPEPAGEVTRGLVPSF